MRRIAYVRVLTGVCVVLCAFGGGMVAQGPQQDAPTVRAVNQTDDPLLKRFVWRSIGPVAMGGRLDDVAVLESDPSTFYLGYATGGVWKTENNGTTFASVFDEYPVSSIGDIAIAPSDRNIIYVGTGEPNNRQSSSFGGGVFKSTDGGKKFAFVGLKETQTIAKIAIHPKDPDTVYVAAAGHLFGPNAERGIYKTTDGGKAWALVKFIDHDTGFIDMVMHPSDPNVIWAASYQRRRQPWGFNGGGPGSGIWRTGDAGKTWTKVSGNGLPENPIIGRIGLDICRSKPNVILAQIEVGPSGGAGAGVNEDGSLAAPTQTAGFGGGRGSAPETAPDPKKSGVWRSEDGGRSWRFMSNNNNRPMYYSKIRVDPSNDQIVYTLGATASKSTDGGKTFNPMGGQSHGDHHTLWINPRNGNHLIIGNDGGLDISYDQGTTWEEVSTMPTGQFYAISADMRKPYYVCGGLQDNGSWCGPSAVRSNAGILLTDWYRIGGGDGFYTQNDPVRMDDRLLGVAGRQHQPLQPENRRDAKHQAARSRWTRGPRRRRAAGADLAGPAGATGAAASAATIAGCSGAAGRATPSRRRPRRQPGRQHLPAAAAGDEPSFLLEHAVHPLAARSAHDLPWRRTPLSIEHPRGYLVRVARPDEQRRAQRQADHGCAGHGTHGLQT